MVRLFSNVQCCHQLGSNVSVTLSAVVGVLMLNGRPGANTAVLHTLRNHIQQEALLLPSVLCFLGRNASVLFYPRHSQEVKLVLENES